LAFTGIAAVAVHKISTNLINPAAPANLWGSLSRIVLHLRLLR